ncbi:MAG: RES family NAD+ phosphorylase [Sulfurovum sp.]
MKDYFCEHCFEDENIKQYIRDYGEKIEKKLDCSFCTFETEIDEWDTDECIDEYIQKCMETYEKELTTEEFEDSEIELNEQCIKECKVKYQKICEDKFIKPVSIIKQEIFIQKIREVILKLYTYDFDGESDYLYNNADKNEIDEWYVDSLIANNEVYTLEEIFDGLNIDFDDGLKNNFKDIFNKHICSSNTYTSYKDYEEIEWLRNEDRLWKYNCLYSTDEYKLQDWEAFREHTKHKARYFEHKDNKFSVIKTLEDFKPFFKKMTTSSDKLIYRVRPIYKEEDKEDIRKNPSVELGKIPQDKLKYTRNNRFSPIGISYGYFAFDKETALVESRVKVNDEVGIGEFKLDKSLKLIDFTNDNLSKYLNPFSDDFNIDLYCTSSFVKSFIQDISKPISDDDSLLEYVPTQIMAEYIWSIGDYDGFIFDSSQKKGGENIVIFGDNPQYDNYQIAKVTNIKYHLEEVK